MSNKTNVTTNNEVVKGEVVKTLDQTKRAKLIEKYQKAQNTLLKNTNRDTWNVVKTINEICTSKDFTEAFENVKDFAPETGYSASAISRMNIVYPLIEQAKKVEEHPETATLMKALSYTQAVELMYIIPKNNRKNPNILDFIMRVENLGITADMTIKEIREIVSNYNKLAIEQKEEETEEQEEITEGTDNETVEEPKEDTNVINIEYMGETLVQLSKDIPNLDKHLLEMRELVCEVLRNYYRDNMM